jgi:type II secretion system protein C
MSLIPTEPAPVAIIPGQMGLVEPPGVAKPLKLFAVTVGANANEGLAVLGPAEASSRTYVAGAVLENGAQLAEVHSDHVVLKRNRELYRLYLPTSGKADEMPRQASALTVGDFPAPAPPLVAPAMRTTDHVRVAPVYQGEAISGYAIYPGARRGEFDRAGLKEGDILIALNGQATQDPDQVSAALDQLTTGAMMIADVRRGEETVLVKLGGSRWVATSSSIPAGR